MKLTGTINPPTKPLSIPAESQWLGGQGTGGWFYLEPTPNSKEYRIARFSPEGVMECDRIFILDSDLEFKPLQNFSFTYISHCAECNVLQNDYKFRFVYNKTAYLS